MISIPFNSNYKTRGKCTITMTEEKCTEFTIFDENVNMCATYRLKPKLDHRFNFKFILETPYNDDITIPANEYSIKNAIKYIIARETNYPEKEKNLQTIIDLINHPEDFREINIKEEDN